MTDLTHKLAKGRTRVILRDPFFASILMDMDPLIDAGATETCATNGEQIIFNPDWLAQADDHTVAAAMRKMSLHVALSHHLRRGPFRDPAKWRTACDHAALCIMQAEGMQLPDGCNANPAFNGLTADDIYKLLKEQDDNSGDSPQEQPQGGAVSPDGQGDGQGSPNGQNGPQGGAGQPDGVGQALDGADMRNDADVAQKASQNDQRNMRAAMAEKAQGKESGFSKDMVKQIKAKGVNWADRFQHFIDDKTEVRMSLHKPNRRYIAEDIYLAGKVADGIATLAFIVDTSGSMSLPELQMCMTQIDIAREACGIGRVVVIQIDSKVKDVHEFEGDDPLPTDMTFKGRGGTNMKPAFDKALEFDPSVIVCMTDGVFSDLTEDPHVPTLFAITHDGQQGRAPANFGDFVDMPAPSAP